MHISIKMILVVAIVIAISGCKEEVSRERSDIVSVWKHEVGSYSVSVMRGQRIVDVGFRYRDHTLYSYDIGLFTDVPNGSNDWYEATFVDSVFSHDCNVSIHIHSESEINGSGWNHGKFGSGMTERVTQ